MVDSTQALYRIDTPHFVSNLNSITVTGSEQDRCLLVCLFRFFMYELKPSFPSMGSIMYFVFCLGRAGERTHTQKQYPKYSRINKQTPANTQKQANACKYSKTSKRRKYSKTTTTLQILLKTTTCKHSKAKHSQIPDTKKQNKKKQHRQQQTTKNT